MSFLSRLRPGIEVLRRKRLRHILSLAVLLFVCAFLTHAADRPKDELPPPPLFGEGYLPQRAAAAVFGESVGINSPLRQAVIVAIGHQTGCFETDPPLRGESLTPYLASSVLLGSVPGNAPAFNSTMMLHAGEFAGCWSLEDNTQFRPLEGVMQAIRDNAPLASLTDRTPIAVEEAFIFQDGLLKSLRLKKEAFDRVAVSNFTIDELEANPARYRGRVLSVFGYLKRIRAIDPPPLLRRFGAPKLYEVWVVVKSGDVWRQVCLLTPVSFGFKPDESFPKNVEVELTGYFFKLFRFEKGGGVPGQPGRSVPLFLGHGTAARADRESRIAMAAMSVLSAGDGSTAGGFAQASLLCAGERAHCWTVEDASQVPALDPRYLDSVKDNTMMPRLLLGDDDQGTSEIIAYYDAIIKASKTSLDRFRASLVPDTTYVHLNNEPGRYRGRVVSLEGMLRRVRRFEPSLYEKQNGVKNVYEVWLIDEKHPQPDREELEVNPKSDKKVYPAAILLCTELPPGIKVAEEVTGQVPVTFIGYFFKRYLYKPAEVKKKGSFRAAPMLIGQIIPPKKPNEADSAWVSSLVPFILLMLMGTFVIVFLMTWGFRRADNRVRARVDAVAPPFIAASEPPEKENEPPFEGERRI
jgi:hypothetical protein